MRQQDHYNNTYNYSQDKTQTTPESKQQSLNTTDRQQHSASYNNSPHNHPACQPTMLEDKHPWTLTQCTKEKENTKEKVKAKENIKAKATVDTTATATTITTKEKERMEGKDTTPTTIQLDTAILLEEKATKDTKDTTKEKEKERTKENKWPIPATGVGEQDTMPKTAE